jgi:hypothetical protein
MKELSWSPAAPVSMPERQGFYWVRTTAGAVLIAEFCRNAKTKAATWIHHVAEEPTAKKELVDVTASVCDWAKAEKADVEKARKRLLTLEERVQKAVDAYCNNIRLYEGHKPYPIPEARKFAIGDAVIVGNLKSPRVVGLAHDGQTVVVEYSSERSSNRGSRFEEAPDYETEIGAWYWTHVLKADRPKVHSAFSKENRMYGAFSAISLDFFLGHYLERGLDDSPEFQRDYVWTDKDKEAYLDSLFMGRDVGRFIKLKRKFPHSEVLLDGKQRLNTLVAFYTGHLAYKGMFYHELAFIDMNRFDNTVLQVATLEEERYSRADLLEIFLEVNCAGVPQSEEHLEHVRRLLDEERTRSA